MVRAIIKEGPALKRLKAALPELGKMRLKVGYFETAKYSDGTPVAYVAAIQEFGYPGGGIPARPTMRPTADAQGNPGGEWSQIAAQGAKAILKGSATPGQVMDALGLKAAGDIRKAISKLQSPPLKPSTVAARQRGMADRKTTGSLTKPLVATGLMINSVGHEVG